MRAQAYSQFGGPEVLELRHDLPEPSPNAHEILVEVHASSINPIDWKLRRGNLRRVMRQSFPFIPGRDFAGVVLECGSHATGVALGDVVFGLCPLRGPGSHADRVCVPESCVALAPARVGVHEAAALPLCGLTAVQAVDAASLQPQQRVLVLGGGGGVGSLAVQYACHLGADVFATAGARNLEYLRSLGATPIDYRLERIEERLHDIDAVIDCVGGESERRAFGLLRRGGRLISIAGPDPDVEVSLINVARVGVPASLRVARQLTRGRRYQFISARVDHRALVRLAQLVDRGVLDVRIDRSFPLARLGEAQRISEAGEARGKLVIDHQSAN